MEIGINEQNSKTNCLDCERYKRLGEVCVLEHGKKFLWQFCKDFQTDVKLPDYEELMKTVRQDLALQRKKIREKKKKEVAQRKKEREVRKKEKLREKRSRIAKKVWEKRKKKEEKEAARKEAKALLKRRNKKDKQVTLSKPGKVNRIDSVSDSKHIDSSENS